MVIQGAEKAVFAVKAQLQPEVGVFLLDMPPQAGKGIADPVPGQAEADQARDVARRRPGIVPLRYTSSISSHARANSSPAAVSATVRVLRSTSLRFSSLSSAAMLLLRAGWVMYSCFAA